MVDVEFLVLVTRYVVEKACCVGGTWFQDNSGERNACVQFLDKLLANMRHSDRQTSSDARDEAEGDRRGFEALLCNARMKKSFQQTITGTTVQKNLTYAFKQAFLPGQVWSPPPTVSKKRGRAKVADIIEDHARARKRRSRVEEAYGPCSSPNPTNMNMQSNKHTNPDSDTIGPSMAGLAGPSDSVRELRITLEMSKDMRRGLWTIGKSVVEHVFAMTEKSKNIKEEKKKEKKEKKEKKRKDKCQ